MPYLLKRLGHGMRSLLYDLTGWVLGIAIFLCGYLILGEHFSWGGIAAILLTAYISAGIIIDLATRLVNARQKRIEGERFTRKMQGQQCPLSLTTGQPTAFSPQWEAVLASPAATIFLSANDDSVRIVSHDLSHDVLMPVGMIEQVEFDPGDGPPYRQDKGMSWQRKLFGQPFAPTVFLGIRCTDGGALFVYPLCFLQHAGGDARDLYRRLTQTLQSAAATFPFQLSNQALEEKLPPCRKCRSMRTETLQRFWPNYRARWPHEWLNK